MDLLLRIIVPNISTEYFSRIFAKKKVKKNIWKVVNFLHLLQFKPGSGQIWARFGLGSGHVQTRFGLTSG